MVLLPPHTAPLDLQRISSDELRSSGFGKSCTTCTSAKVLFVHPLRHSVIQLHEQGQWCASLLLALPQLSLQSIAPWGRNMCTHMEIPT